MKNQIVKILTLLLFCSATLFSCAVDNTRYHRNGKNNNHRDRDRNHHSDNGGYQDRDHNRNSGYYNNK